MRLEGCSAGVSVEEPSTAGPGQQVQVPNPSTAALAWPGSLRGTSSAALVRSLPQESCFEVCPSRSRVALGVREGGVTKGEVAAVWGGTPGLGSTSALGELFLVFL